MKSCICTGLKKNTIRNNKGFSLVELLVCVGILAVAAIPLLKTFGMTAKVNMRSQELQNATSLAESVMEEVKTLSIAELKQKYESTTDYSFNSSTATLGSTYKVPSYTLKREGVTATQGELFDVEVNIVTDSYTDSSTDKASFISSGASENVINANNLRLPVLMEYDSSSSSYKALDTSSQMMISETDFTKFDAVALNYFVNCKAVKQSATLTKKDIVIDKTYDNFGGNSNIYVKCKVTYSYNDGSGNPGAETFSRELFSGVYSKASDDKLDTNIYLFYSQSVPTETITINDKTAVGTHKVFFIKQDGVDGLAGTTITLNHTTDDGSGPGGKAPEYVPGSTALDSQIVLSSSSYGALDDNGNIERVDSTSGKNEKANSALVTNLKKNTGKIDKFYDTDACIRIYDITVNVYEHGDSTPCATLTSTKEVREVL